MKKLRLFLLTLLVVPLALYAQPSNLAEYGEQVIKKEKLESFKELEITNGALVTIQYALDPAISIIGYQDCIDGVSTKVTSNRLHIDSQNSEMNCSVEIVLEVPVITDVTLRNGGTVDLTAVTTETMFASIHNGGEIKAAVHDFLYGKIIDGGEINYIGNPDVQSDIVGGGTLSQTDPFKVYAQHHKSITASL